MTDYNPTVMLWLRQRKEAEQARRVREQLAELTGVLAVTSSVRSPRSVLIKYERAAHLIATVITRCPQSGSVGPAVGYVTPTSATARVVFAGIH